MKLSGQGVLVVGGLAIVLLAMSAVHAALAPAEQAAIFKAAGFKKARDGRYVACQDGTSAASYTPGAIELVDLNGDGRPEAWVTETSMHCYGSPHTYFALLRKDAGVWRQLLSDTGTPGVLKAKHHGWPDIEVGGPGFGKFPFYRWNGKSYLRITPKQN